jgi:hypothetical protein
MDKPPAFGDFGILAQCLSLRLRGSQESIIIGTTVPNSPYLHGTKLGYQKTQQIGHSMSFRLFDHEIEVKISMVVIFSWDSRDDSPTSNRNRRLQAQQLLSRQKLTESMPQLC